MRTPKQTTKPVRRVARRSAYQNPPPTEVPANAPVEEVKAEFARRLNAFMVRKGWNQSELARRAEGYSPGKRFGRDNVSVYIRGMVLPGPLHLNALAQALGVEPSDLLPTRGVPQAGDKNPTFDMRDLGDGRVWLRVNQAIEWDVAMEIMKLLKDRK